MTILRCDKSPMYSYRYSPSHYFKSKKRTIEFIPRFYRCMYHIYCKTCANVIPTWYVYYKKQQQKTNKQLQLAITMTCAALGYITRTFLKHICKCSYVWESNSNCISNKSANVVLLPILDRHREFQTPNNSQTPIVHVCSGVCQEAVVYF